MRLNGRLAATALTALALMGMIALTLSVPSQAKEMTVRMKEPFAFDPPSMEAMPGESITLLVINEGTTRHSFTLFEEKDASVPWQNDPDLQQYNTTHDKIVDVWLDGGNEKTVTFTAPVEPGTYTYVCMVPLHASGGMRGELVVSEEPGGIDSLTIGIVVGIVIVVVAVVVLMFLRRSRT